MNSVHEELNYVLGIKFHGNLEQMLHEAEVLKRSEPQRAPAWAWRAVPAYREGWKPVAKGYIR